MQGKERLTSGLEPLLGHISSELRATDAQPESIHEHEWQGWRISPVAEFHTHPVFRARRKGRDIDDLAVKFIAAGPRDGAGCEYASLSALHLAGLEVAPEPLLLDRESYVMPVVVTTWLRGDVHEEPPETDEEWLLLARHLATVSQITPFDTQVALRPAVVSLRSSREAVERFKAQVSTIPSVALPGQLGALARHIEHRKLPDWHTPRLALIRNDPNTRNFVRRPGAWASVDWEDSGWGDLAADMGDLMAHPTYRAVPASRWEWLAETYGQFLGDPAAPERIRLYYALTVAWWAANLAGKLHRLSTGDNCGHYVGRPADWENYLREHHDWYCQRAWELITATFD